MSKKTNKQKTALHYCTLLSQHCIENRINKNVQDCPATLNRNSARDRVERHHFYNSVHHLDLMWGRAQQYQKLKSASETNLLRLAIND